jgi:hypothetical protein
VKERNEIDRLLKDKLGEKVITFNERHWMEMEKLLNRRKRRGVFFFFTLALLLSGFLGFAVLKDTGVTKVSAIPLRVHATEVEIRQTQATDSREVGQSENASREIADSGDYLMSEVHSERSAASTSALATKKKDTAGTQPKSASSNVSGVGSKATANLQGNADRGQDIQLADGEKGKTVVGAVNDEERTDFGDHQEMAYLSLLEPAFEAESAALVHTFDSFPPVPKPFRFELIGFGTFGKQQIMQTQAAERASELAKYDLGTSTSFGVLFQARYNGWLAASGVDVTRISETADYGSYNSTIEELVEVTILDSLFIGQEFIVDSIFIENIQIWQVDTIFFDVYEYFEQTYVDTLVGTEKKPRKDETPFSQVVSQVEVPLLFGKAFHFGKFELNILGGPAIAITTKVEGYVIEGSRLLERRTLSKDVTLNLHLRAGLSYALNDRWAFQVHTGYRRNATSILKFQGLEQRYSGIGFGGGLVYRFGGR